MMIHWWGLVIVCFACFMVGGFIGMAIMAMCVIAKQSDKLNEIKKEVL